MCSNCAADLLLCFPINKKQISHEATKKMQTSTFFEDIFLDVGKQKHVT